jgi:hypothetical protein
MNYPVWQLGFPGGLLIAAVAVLHVFISHFAVGGGAYLVLTERRAYARNDSELLGYVRHHSKFFALLTVVLGAVTGVGIWFTIGLVSPEATSSLIHTFVWGWAIEWVFFFVEIAAALIYAYQWDTLDRQTHLIIGWIYFVAAWASLVVINGIITYMLTPGRWLENRNFWSGFFNPTYWPSLWIRTAMAAVLAGIFGLVTAMWEPSALRERVVRWAGWWLALGIAFLLPLSRWYFRDFPSYSRAYFNGMYVGVHHALVGAAVCAGVALILALLFALLWPKLMNPVVVAVLLVAGISVMGSGEYLREFARYPSSTATSMPTTSGWEGWRLSPRMVSPRLRLGSKAVLMTHAPMAGSCLPCSAVLVTLSMAIVGCANLPADGMRNLPAKSCCTCL